MWDGFIPMNFEFSQIKLRKSGGGGVIPMELPISSFPRNPGGKVGVIPMDFHFSQIELRNQDVGRVIPMIFIFFPRNPGV